MPFPEPTERVGDRAEVLLTYLDFFRSTVADKIGGLGEDDLRRSVLPSGWSPLELVKHLVFMERRWLVWGFLGVPVAEPWGDDDAAGRWRVGRDESARSLLDALRTGGRRTREIVETAASVAQAAPRGARFAPDEPAPTLERVLLHVLQEYARHVGHLDVVRELLDGETGD
ncbi:MAG: DinB family protein [Nocardioidaceae bacterium]